MMNIDLPDDSDTSDEDYNPGEKEEEVVSEIESDDPISDSEETKDISKTKKKGKKAVKRAKKKDKGESIVLGLFLDNSRNNQEQLQAVEREDRKKKEDDLWADFMKDTGFRSKNSQKLPEKSDSSISNSSSEKKLNTVITKPPLQKPTEKVKVTQIFEFAGEEVQVEKEVPADSAEARLLAQSSDNEVSKTNKGKRRGGLSGINNVLSQLSKKPKISTLEKTKMDWDKFKKEENIEEELQNYNKGKDGYLDRQDFLERADLRRFEIEREIRTIERNKRFNSTL